MSMDLLQLRHGRASLKQIRAWVLPDQPAGYELAHHQIAFRAWLRLGYMHEDENTLKRSITNYYVLNYRLV